MAVQTWTLDRLVPRCATGDGVGMSVHQLSEDSQRRKRDLVHLHVAAGSQDPGDQQKQTLQVKLLMSAPLSPNYNLKPGI